MLNLHNISVHFIGIGGISMSGLAKILLVQNCIVSGSDSQKSDILTDLEEKGATIFYEHNKNNITKNIDLVVYSAAIKDENEERQKAVQLGIKTIDRAELVGAILKDFDYPICISGTHGKTTTTAMVSDVLLSLNVDPTLSVGGILSSIGSNFKMGKKDYFVIEACEYSDSFFKFFPYVGLILNVEYDHTDYFSSLAHVQSSFNSFARNISHCLVINNEIPNIEEITKDVPVKIITFGLGGDFYATNIINNPFCTEFTLNYFGNTLDMRLNMPGDYNIQNALATLATVYAIGLSVEDAAVALGVFEGIERRYQYKGMYNKGIIIDDYAHHPTEIKKVLSIKHIGGTKICLFQPHTYSRTIAFLDDFAKSFAGLDCLVLLDIYAAREPDLGLINSKILAAKIKEQKDSPTEVIYCSSFEQAKDYLAKKIQEGDLLITMGAGFAHEIGEALIRSS